MSKENKLIEVLKAAQEQGIKVESKWRNGSSDWTEIPSPTWSFSELQYRILRRKRGGTRRITAKDWEGRPVVWVRMTQGSEDVSVAVIDDCGFKPADRNGLIEWKDCGFDGDEYEYYSFDRKTWHPFEVEEGEGEWEVIATTEDAQ